MMFARRFLLLVLLCLGSTLPARAQTPRLFMKFDGSLADSSGAGIITTVTPNFTITAGTYVADRFGVASRALPFSGSRSLQLIAGAAVGNSNQALGLRNAGGTNTSFTLATWVYFDSIGAGQGYSTIFGNTGSGAGTLHAGVGNGTALQHFGFEGNDANALTTTLVTGQWYHLTFVYNAATLEQRLYINGVPEIVRSGVNNTTKLADLFLGNWGTAADASNDLKGRLDDVLVYNVALDAGQVQAVFSNVNPLALPAAGTYSAPKLSSYYGTPGFWGVREIKGYTLTGYAHGPLVNADRIIRNYDTNAGGATKLDYQTPVINMKDADSGLSGYFTGDLDFGTGVAGTDDNNVVMVAQCAVRITEEDDYTFGFRGDEGSRLRVLGRQFLSSTRLATTNNINPAHHGDGIYYIQGTSDSNTIGVVHLPPGDYNLELTYWEGTGGAAVEVFAARGAKVAVDASFRLVGDTANGGLELVRDPDTLPQVQTFTVNGGSTLFVHGGAPATVTLAWQTNALPTSLLIDQGIGPVAIPSGTLNLPAPAVTTTYTITAQNGADITSKSVTVYVDAPPLITSFTASDTTVTTGSATTLSWVTNGATSLTLNPGNINVTGLTSRVVNPTTTTTYTLTATNVSGSTPQNLLIQVGVGPVITSFTVADPNPLFGAETQLAWNVANATSLSINQGVGAVSPPTTGTAAVLATQTTSYILTATNAFTSTTASTTLTIATPIGVLSPGFNCRRVSAKTTTPFPFTGQGYLDSAVTLVGETVGGAHYLSESTANYATINFTDGTDGEFTSGNSSFPGGSGDNFAMRATATLVVNTPGEYTFVVNSDDGARLRIDGQDVIVDDGTHGPSSSSGKITLNNPTAQLELIYFDTTGTAALELGWIRPNLQWQLLGIITAAAPVVRGQVLLSEFMADNKNTLLDEDGSSSDWIEVWNSTTSTVNLSGYYLTDDAAVPNKWAFPAWTLGANKFAVVFASQKDRKPAQAVAGQDNPGTVAQPHLHTSFNINKTTGYLALTKDDGSGGFTTLTAFSGYPSQAEDVSYGSSDAEGYLGYMETPTPGRPNAVTVQGFVSKVQFSHQRGRYSVPFSLAMTCATPDAIIRYTTDGSTPSRTRGTIYAGPVVLGATTVVRALAYRPGWKGTDIETQSYLFVDDIVTQTAATANALGFPNGPIAPRSQVLRYGMTLGNVTSGGGTLQSLKDALAAAPTVCMTTDVANLMDATTGIYANADKHGLFWERPASIEYINAAGTSEFQIDCGARIRGGYSRSQSNPKHAFHLYFRGSLYDGDLKYPLFGTQGASEFGQLDMRCEENYSWSFDNSGQNSLMREEWSRVSGGDMGQPYARNGYFHLYINGIYWGVYNWEERTEAGYGETYLGGLKDNIDTVKSAGSSGNYDTEMTDGNFAAWENLYKQAIALKNDATTEASRTARYMKMRGLNPDGTSNATYPVLLDVDNLIDYILIIFYDGSFDSPLSTFLSNASNNWFGVRDRLGSRGFAFFIHDNEHGMESVSDGRAYNRVGPWGGSGNNNWSQPQYSTRESIVNTFYSKSNPQYLHEMLAYSAEYRQRFADRVQRHYFNGGALTTAGALNRLNTLAAQVDPIIHAEAARWGSASLNRASWLTAKATVTSFINTGGTAQSGFTNFGAQTNGRNSLTIQQLQGYQDPVGSAKALFTTFAAPTFSGPFGGSVTNPHTFNITNPNGTGTLYYTLNGTDPRAPGGSIAAGALTGSSPRPVTLTNTATVRARVYNSTTQVWSALTEADYIVGALASSANIVISKIHYNPLSASDLEEFIEIMNISAQNVDLTDCEFTLGVQFLFPTGYILAPGARALIVRDTAAFTAAYPSVPAGQIVPGVFANSTNLSNSGERLQFLNAADVVIRDFTYSDAYPWPEAADGAGPSLVLIRPETNPDHSLPANWRASTATGGSPGVTDATNYAAWSASQVLAGSMTGDDDGDGSKNLAEYFFGTGPHDPTLTGNPILSVQSVDVGGVISSYLTIVFTRTLGRDDVTFTAECIASLSTPPWGTAILVGKPVNNGNGTETYTYRYPSPVPNPAVAGTQQFLRLKISQVP